MRLLPLLLLLPGVAYADPVSIIAAAIVSTFGVPVAVATTYAAVALAVGTIAANVYGAAAGRRKARREAARQRAEYNASLEDRSVTTLTANPPQRVIYGRCITGGDIVAIFTSDKTGTRSDGTSYTKPDALKHLVIVIAAHQVQSINEVYIDGVALGTLDGNGWVTGGEFFISNAPVQHSRTISAGGSYNAGAEVTLLGAFYQWGAGLDSEYTQINSLTLSAGNTTINNPEAFAVTATFTTTPTVARVRVSKALGTESQTVDTYLNSVVPSQWDSSCRLRGLAYCVVTLDLEEPRFQGGPPNITFDVSGKLVYDTRTATTAWSDNPALCIRDFLVSTYGYACASTDIDVALCNAAANACDARQLAAVHSHSATFSVFTTPDLLLFAWPRWFGTGDGVRFTTTGTLPSPLVANTTYYAISVGDSGRSFRVATSAANAQAGTYINITSTGSGTHTCTWYDYATYTANGAFSTLDSREAVLEDLCESMAGFATYGATWGIVAGAWTASVMTLTDDDLDGQIEVLQAGAGMDALFNGLRGQIVASGKATPSDFDPYQNSTFVTADGQALWTDITLPFTNNKARAKNLARIFVERNRQGLVIRYPAKLRAWPLQIGDRVTVNSTEYGFSGKTFRVTDWQFGASTAVMLTLQEDIASVYDLADAATADPAPNTNLPNPWVVAALSGVTATSGDSTVLKSESQGIIPRIVLSWNAITDAYIVNAGGYVDIAWQRPSGQWNEQSVPGDQTSVYIIGPAHGEPILIRASARNSIGAVSPSVYKWHIVSGAAAVSLSPNLIYNSAFESGLNGWSAAAANGFTPTVGVNWTSTYRLLPATAPWTSVIYMEQLASATNVNWYYERGSNPVSVKPSTRYILSGYLQMHRATGNLFVRGYTAAGAAIASMDGAGGATANSSPQADANTLAKFQRVSAAFTTTSDCASVVVYVRKYDTLSGTNSYLFATRFMLEEAATSTVGASDWRPGAEVSISGVTTDGLVSEAATEIFEIVDSTDYTLTPSGTTSVQISESRTFTRTDEVILTAVADAQTTAVGSGTKPYLRAEIYNSDAVVVYAISGPDLIGSDRQTLIATCRAEIPSAAVSAADLIGLRAYMVSGGTGYSTTLYDLKCRVEIIKR